MVTRVDIVDIETHFFHGLCDEQPTMGRESKQFANMREMGTDLGDANGHHGKRD
jgi:hypothetical protein